MTPQELIDRANAYFVEDDFLDKNIEIISPVQEQLIREKQQATIRIAIMKALRVDRGESWVNSPPTRK